MKNNDQFTTAECARFLFDQCSIQEMAELRICELIQDCSDHWTAFHQVRRWLFSPKTLFDALREN